MVLFGIPLHAHEDDARRCLLAALEIHKVLSSPDLNCTCGIASGTAYCGTIGSSHRREYATVGNAVNIAARLMQTATDVICDETTARSAADSVSFYEHRLLQLKGQSGPLSVFRPFTSVRTATSATSAPDIIGREFESDLVRRNLDALADGRPYAHVFVEGEPGVGKSNLLDHIDWLASAADVRVLRSSADSIERETPYFSWRSIFHPIIRCRG